MLLFRLFVIIKFFKVGQWCGILECILDTVLVDILNTAENSWSFDKEGKEYYTIIYIYMFKRDVEQVKPWKWIAFLIDIGGLHPQYTSNSP